MMDTEVNDLQRKLTELGKRIAQRQRELRTRGIFANAHETYFRDLTAQHIRLADRLQIAANSPRGHLVGTQDELVRDYNALMDDCTRMVDHLDSNEIKTLFE